MKLVLLGLCTIICSPVFAVFNNDSIARGPGAVYSLSTGTSGIAGYAWSVVEATRQDLTNVDTIGNYMVFVRSYPSGKLILTQYSDSQGRFNIKLRPGRYAVRAVMWNYYGEIYYGKLQIGKVKANHCANLALDLALEG